MNYKIVTGTGLTTGGARKDLVKKVNEAIAEGWRPQGGMITWEQGPQEFSQAMVRPLPLVD